MGFIDRAIGIIVRPDGATKDIAGDPRIEEGVLWVGVYIILMAISGFVALSRVHVVGSINGVDASTLTALMPITGTIGAMLIGLIGWPFIAGACHVLSLFFGGKGKFYPQMMTLVGYASIPLIIALIPSILLAFFAMPVTTVDISQGSQAMNDAMGDPVWILDTVISIAGAAWAAYVMARAVKNGEKIDMGPALLIVGLLFLANLLYQYNSIIFALL